MKTVHAFSILLLLFSAVPLQAEPQEDTRLEGLVLGIDGRPAAGYRVHLIDDAGVGVVQAAVGDDGVYSMRGVPAGRYDLALETPDGRYAAVDASAMKVRQGHLVRRDVKLLQRDPSAPASSATTSASMGTWWAGLETGARAWTIVAIVVVAAITVEALSSDETAASQTNPPI